MTKPVTMLDFLRHRIDSDEWGARFFGADEYLAAVYADHPDYQKEWKP